MAVKTVNAQGYGAVMAVKGAAAASLAAKTANAGSQNFGELLNKAGDKAAYSENAAVNDAQASKKPEVRADKISAGGQKPGGRLSEAKTVKEAENEQAVTDEKPAGGTKSEKANTEKVKTEEPKAKEMPDAGKTAEADEAKEEPDDKMTIAQISDALMQIIEQIKELLGISDEELLLGLEQADLKLTDLLDPAGMSKLLIEAAGAGDVMSLVTNGELYANLQELTKTAENVSKQLLEELGLTQEEFDAMLENLKDENLKLEKLLQPESADALKIADSQDLANPQPENIGQNAAAESKAGVKAVPEKEIAAGIKAEIWVSEEAAAAPEIKTQAAADAQDKTKQSPETQAKPADEIETKAVQEVVTEPVNKSEAALADEEAEETETAKTAAPEEEAGIPTETKQPDKTAADDAGINTANNAGKKQADSAAGNLQNDTAAVGGTQQKARRSDTQERGGSNGQKNSSNNFGGQPGAQSFDGKLDAIQTAAQTLARYTSENTQGILRQLADIVRIARDENLTQMEMQLHPASLGTVNVSLVTKGGSVTAEFVTQNEAAKAAIEANAVQLIKNLEEQGVKVEAVEVAVAGHQLEKNLDENSRKEQRRQEEAQRIQGSRRSSINFNSFSDDEELLEEMQDADDATRIAMELMAANGNSMDLMV